MLQTITLPETNSSHLKHWGWKMSFLFGSASCQVRTVSFRECMISLRFFRWRFLVLKISYIGCMAVPEESRVLQNRLLGPNQRKCFCACFTSTVPFAVLISQCLCLTSLGPGGMKSCPVVMIPFCQRRSARIPSPTAK